MSTLRSDQSTLTQLDWVNTSDSSKETSEVITIPSQDEYDDERPTKRRRKSHEARKEQRQSTLTQMIDRPRPRNVKVGEYGFQIWQDEYPDDQQSEEAQLAQRQGNRQRRTPWLGQSAQDDDENDPEIPESSAAEPPSSPRSDSAVEFDTTKQHEVRTPVKHRVLGIPSTQTPPSTISSARDRFWQNGEQRSPLKERSINMQPQGLVREASKTQRQTQKVPLNDVCSSAPLPENSSPSSPESSTNKTPDGLLRVNTVPDSQPEDEECYTPTRHTGSAWPERAFKRTGTVQDSQFDEDEILSQLPALSKIPLPQYHASYGDYTQATLDPVYSALSRDAARFRWTQTQRAAAAKDGVCEDSDTDDEDLDRGCGLNNDDDESSEHGLEVVELQAEASHAGLGYIVQPYPFTDDANFANDVAVESNDGGDQSCGEDHEGETVEVVPSSPPCLRSSQDSIIVTKESLAVPRSGIEASLANDSIAHTYLSEASTIVPYSSPSQIEGRFQDAPKGSAIPLPPWNSSYETLRIGGNDGRSKLEITDWSLPPPPPMSSSKAATPASSSSR